MAEGFKAWTGGQVLNAADLTDYASSQAVMRFANAAGRDAALTASVVQEGMLVYLKDTNTLVVNTDGSTTGWLQIYPVITTTISDAQVTNAKLSANSVSSSNIIDATIVGADIAAGTITGSNIASGTITGANIQDGSIGTADLAAGTYGISISGNAATATNATNATNANDAINALTLTNLSPTTTSTGNSIVARTSGGEVKAVNFNATGGTAYSFYDSGTYTYLGLDCMRVLNSDFVYSTPISGGRTVLVSSGNTLGTSTSSRRFKEDMSALPYSPADILKMNPILFRYRADHVEPDADRPMEVGLIAEELDELGFEELIFRGKEGQPDGIAYEKIAVALLKVCQDQQTQLDALSARLDALEANGAN
jgi:hypothetical protein